MDALLTAGGMAIAVTVWLVRIEGRVHGHDRELRILRDDIRYVRSRIDQALANARDERINRRTRTD
jgi:hypothetical protein